MIKWLIKKRNERLINKKNYELKKRFPTSNVSPFAFIDDKTHLEGENVINAKTNVSSSVVGKCTVIGGRTSLSNCKIGSFCSIASDVHVQPWTHPTAFVSSYPGFFNTGNNYPFGKGITFFDEELKTADGYHAEIGNDVWIGEHVIIKGGVTIHDGAVIGMGSVVTKDVPPYAIIGGCPAKVIKYRFDDKTINSLILLKWWNWPLEKIKENRDLFCNFSLFCQTYLNR